MDFPWYALGFRRNGTLKYLDLALAIIQERKNVDAAGITIRDSAVKSEYRKPRLTFTETSLP